ALMHRGIELRDREKLVAAHEASLVPEGLELGKPLADRAGREMAVLAFEHQERRVLAKNPLRTLQEAKFSAFDIDLEQRDLVDRIEIIVERDHWHRQGC